MRFLLVTLLCAFTLFGLGPQDAAADATPLPVDREEPLTTAEEEPVELDDILIYEPVNKVIEDGSLPFDIRKEALQEAALSFGARGGLAKRTYEIRTQLDMRARYLNRVFDFSKLLVSAPSGFLIEPPVITESMNNMIVDIDGQTAAVSDKIYNIMRNARIVSAPRTWHAYLEREWGEVIPPPDILTPRDEEEREVWVDFAAQGWALGYQQANDIFADDLARLEADYQGMIRYRMLLAQGMVSPPYALQVDRGITGGGDEMHIGNRAVQITGVPELMSGADTWKPASR